MFPRRNQPLDFRARDARLRAERRELEELCHAHDLPLPWGPYRAAPHMCFRCGERTVVYTWVHHRVRGSDWPPGPRPGVLRRRKTQESGGMEYWANVCAHCGVTQGDNYLYDQGGANSPPPFRSTWRKASPEIPGGPVAVPDADAVGAPVPSTAGFLQRAFGRGW